MRVAGPSARVESGSAARTARRTAEGRRADGAASTRATGPISASPDPVADSVGPGIWGRVLLRDSGLGNVPVVLETLEGERVEALSFVGRDEQQGFFAFRPVPPGRYRLRLELPERSGVRFRDSMRVVEVRDGARAARVAFTGDLRPEAEVRGTVRDPDGRPLPGVRVSLSGDALEGYPHDLVPTLDSLSWRGVTTTDSEGRYAISAPPGWYHLTIWRDEWLESLDFARYQYRSANPVLAPGEVDEVDFDFREFASEPCVAGSLAYGERVERVDGSMHCGEALHPNLTRFEIWSFEGRAGDNIEISTALDGDSPLYLMGPDSAIVAADHGHGFSEERGIRTMLERTGTHFILVSHSAAAWLAPDPYVLELERIGRMVGAP